MLDLFLHQEKLVFFCVRCVDGRPDFPDFYVRVCGPQLYIIQGIHLKKLNKVFNVLILYSILNRKSDE